MIFLSFILYLVIQFPCWILLLCKFKFSCLVLYVYVCFIFCVSLVFHDCSTTAILKQPRLFLYVLLFTDKDFSRKVRLYPNAFPLPRAPKSNFIFIRSRQEGPFPRHMHIEHIVLSFIFIGQ